MINLGQTKLFAAQKGTNLAIQVFISAYADNFEPTSVLLSSIE